MNSARVHPADPRKTKANGSPAAMPVAGDTLPWQADCGDGHYRNPVLHADYSDPDAIRVGDDYWLTSSSFGHVPGLPILHSRDLVNWTIVNHALPRLVPESHFSRPRHGEGVWAPALRFHSNAFWIFYPDPDFGLYAITAIDPRDEWSRPVLVKAGRGLIDPCPFWDEDGQGYLIHGWAKSRAGVCNRLTLHRLATNGLGVTDEGRTIVDGDAMPGWKTIEGPKLYKRNGYYYIFAPAGGVAEGYQAVFRSRSIDGPYENRIVLAQGGTPVNGPHQGAWVDTRSRENWFVHFQELPALGRVMHLQPMRWRDDWPSMGAVVDGAQTGEPVLRHTKPDLPVEPLAVPQTSDEFDRPRPGLQWQWQANPQPDWASVDAKRRVLRLRCVQLPERENAWGAGHLLMQKFPGPTFSATTTVRLVGGGEGDIAGLIVFGFDYAWLGLRRCEGRVRLVLVSCLRAHEGGKEDEVAAVEIEEDVIGLRVSVATGGCYRFSYRAKSDGPWTSIGAEFKALSSYWVGAKVGLFASSPATPGATAAGYGEFGPFRVTGA